jgi:methylmalonyl-CoA/ethylmalonyl-CoA epimerase
MMKLRHIGIAVDSITAAEKFYKEFLNLKLVDGPFDDPVQKVRVAFYSNSGFAGFEIELIEPLSDDSPGAKIIADTKRSSAYHMCIEVDNLQTTLENIRKDGGIVVSQPVPAVAFDGRRIAWVFTKTRHLLEILES